MVMWPISENHDIPIMVRQTVPNSAPKCPFIPFSLRAISRAPARAPGRRIVCNNIRMEPESKRGPGRPPIDPALRRTESVSASMTQDERDRFVAKAKALGKPVAALAREILLAVLASVLLLWGASSAAGCGSSLGASARASRDTQLVAISVTGSALSLVAHEAQALARHEADTTCGIVSSHEADACVAGVAQRWAPVDAAIDTAHAALEAWLSGVDADPVHAVQASIDAYEAMGRALKGFGIDVPPLPEEVKIALLALAGAGGELIAASSAGADAGTDAGTDAGQ